MPEDDFKLYPLFLLAVATGARLGELLDLDIDLKTNTIHIDTGGNQSAIEDHKENLCT